MTSWFFETVETINGKKRIKRAKSYIFIWASIMCIPLGIYLIVNKTFFGAFLVLTLCPFLLLYPLVRFLFFGGKDSFAAVVTTAVVEEGLKRMISDSFEKKTSNHKKKR